MLQIKEYLLSVIVAAILCSIIMQAMENFRSKHLARLICGIVMTITVLRPFYNIDRLDFDAIPTSYSVDAQEAVAIGKEISYSAWADIIKLETEAYILDKASGMDADISVSVSVQDSPEPIPVAAEITGAVSPYIRNRLQQMMEEDLGIAKENQLWIG